MCVMDIITTTGLMAECVSWDDTGEVRDSLALSCCQLFSSICPEGAYLAGTASRQNLEAATASSCPPIGEGASTLGGRRLSLPPSTLHRGHQNPLPLYRLVEPVVRNLLRPARGLSVHLMDEGRLHLCPFCGGGSWACPCPHFFIFLSFPSLSVGRLSFHT